MMDHAHPWLCAKTRAPRAPWDDAKRAFAGRAAVPVTPADSEPLELWWPAETDLRGAALLRIVIAVDDRVQHRVTVCDRSTGERIGTIDVWFACAGQVFELPLDERATRAALRHGLCLTVEAGTPPLWICAETGPLPLRPHLIADTVTGDYAALMDLFCSEASLQPCNWMEACVLDGLLDWSEAREDARRALTLHLDTFFKPDGRFIHEDVRGRPVDDQMEGVEGTGPMAVLAQQRPKHPALKTAEAFWRSQFHADTRSVYADRMVAETSYSVAYPMMAMARYAGWHDLKAAALQQLEANRSALVQDDDIWLRYDPQTGERFFRGWSRGVAWYYLGLVRTLALLAGSDRPATLLAEVRRVAEWCARYQLPSGAWPCYLHEPGTPPDTSGTAGIAAAIAIAVCEGMLPPSWTAVADQAYEGLHQCIAPDGWLRGVSQSNKKETHAMDIQRSDFRVIAPWGMGLLAQWAAARDRYRLGRATSSLRSSQ